MNQAWVDEQNKKFHDEVFHIKAELIEAITSRYDLDEDDRVELLAALDKDQWSYSEMVKFDHIEFCGFHQYWNNDLTYEAMLKIPEYQDFRVWCADIRKKAQKIYDYWQYDNGRGIYRQYLDSDPVYFEGDIIITDPCYIMKPTLDPGEDRDWVKCDYGSDMSVFGFRTWMIRDTLYGDWSCHTFNTDTEEPIGQFCADAGLVSVFLLEDVLQYNPEYNDHIEKQWTTTLIKDFKGTVQFIVTEHSGVWEEDSEYHKKGDTWTDYEVQVVGEGTNQLTGEPIRFITRQTGL